MGLNHSPRTVSNNLVLAYDVSNFKSYKGPVMQNLANNITMSNASGTGYSLSGSTQTMNVPGLGSTLVYVSTVQNNYTSFTPNSTQCCPSLFGWGFFSVTPSTLYTYGLVYRCDSGYSTPNFMYRYEFTANGGTLLIEAGVHNDANRVSLGDGWYYAWGTFTTQATTTWIGNAATFYYRYSPFIDKVYIAKVMIAPGNYAGMHPRYWPSSLSSRTNTQNILDITNNNSITATSLTYNADGSFVFNGSNNTINLGNTANTQFPHNSPWSLQLAVNIKSYTNTFPGLLIRGSSVSSGVILYFQNNGILYWKHNNTQTSVGSFVFNTPFVITITHDGAGVVKSYINGNFVSNGPSMVSTDTTNDLILGRADEHGNSEIYSVLKYSRELTAEEVRSNFNALRGRYNI